jgi:hypothetical protein
LCFIRIQLAFKSNCFWLVCGVGFSTSDLIWKTDTSSISQRPENDAGLERLLISDRRAGCVFA